MLEGCCITLVQAAKVERNVACPGRACDSAERPRSKKTIYRHDNKIEVFAPLVEEYLT